MFFSITESVSIAETSRDLSHTSLFEVHVSTMSSESVTDQISSISSIMSTPADVDSTEQSDPCSEKSK